MKLILKKFINHENADNTGDIKDTSSELTEMMNSI